MIIAIDGPAASGKGTLASRIAAHFALAHLDTGLLYRAVARDVSRRGGRLDDEVAAARAARELDPESLDDPSLRDQGLGEAASIVARFPEVRDAVLFYQRDFVRRRGGAVLDGRDMGTVIAPHAPAKLYVTARPQVRAERRWRQLIAQGEAVSLEAIIADIAKRDARDGGRDAAPMRPAHDAVLLDTSEMSISAAADAARRIVEAARARWEQS